MIDRGDDEGWIAELAAGLGARWAEVPGAASSDLVIRYEITDAADVLLGAHTIDLGAGVVNATGPDDDGSPGDVTIRGSVETARAIATGQLASLTAFMDGRLAVSGDIDGLVALID